MTEKLAIKKDNYQPKIKVIGVGGCGINAVNTMINRKINFSVKSYMLFYSK